MIRYSRTAPRRSKASLHALLLFSILLAQISYQPTAWAQSVESLDIDINNIPISLSSLPPPGKRCCKYSDYFILAGGGGVCCSLNACLTVCVFFISLSLTLLLSLSANTIEPASVLAQEERIPRHLIHEQATPYIPPPTTFPPDQWGNRIPDFSQV
jgi:hypothetical protein